MPGFLLHVNAVIQCTHGVPAVQPPAQGRVFVMGQPVAVQSSQLTVAGCPFTIPGPKPQPCVRIQWANVAGRVFVMGQPVLLQTGPGPGQGICLSPEQIPNGPPIVSFVQSRVFGM